MIEVQNDDFRRLRRAGLIRDTNDRNYKIVNKHKKQSNKKYFVMEEDRILTFLGLIQYNHKR